MDSAIADGSLERALSLPASAPERVWLRLAHCPDAIAWGDVAGELPDQVELEIYKARKPGDLDRTTLKS